MSASDLFFVSGRIKYMVNKPSPSNVVVSNVTPGNVRFVSKLKYSLVKAKPRILLNVATSPVTTPRILQLKQKRLFFQQWNPIQYSILWSVYDILECQQFGHDLWWYRWNATTWTKTGNQNAHKWNICQPFFVQWVSDWHCEWIKTAW